MRLARTLLALFMVVTGPAGLPAQQREARQLTGRKWIDMEYGPYMTHSFQASVPEGNIAYKGIRIQLGDEGEAVLFDSDLLRFAAGWTRSQLDWRSVVYDGSHGTHPRVVGEPLFSNPRIPGWAQDESFTDPRSLPHGPLPQKWARYKGLYLNGQQVILHYSVAGTEIRETPSLESRPTPAGPTRVLVRTLEIGKSTGDLLLQVCSDAAGGATLVSANTLQPAADDPQGLAAFGLQSPAPATDVADNRLLQGLQAHWKFNESEGPLARNTQGKQFLGTLQGARRADGQQASGLSFDGKAFVSIANSPAIDLGTADFSVSAWIKTRGAGTILARGPAKGKWQPKGKTFFVREGRLCYDVGWVGVVESNRRVNDGRWHHVAVTYGHRDGLTQLYIDGQPDSRRPLKSPDDPAHVVRIGYTATDFVPPFSGLLDEIRLYRRTLPAAEVALLAGRAVAAPQVTAVACRHAPDTIRLEISDAEHIRLRIPAAATPARFKLLLWGGDRKQLGDFAALAKATPPPAPLADRLRGGQSRFPERVTTQGVLGKGDQPFLTDTLTLPDDNPWHSWMRLGGFDFFADARRAAVCTWNGDVWLVDGIEGDLSKLTWQRIATGLFQPLGLRIVKGQIYVCCRDQITRLHDFNGDGETDYYESFNNDHQVTEHFHEFAMDLQTDEQGNFYYAKSARHALDSVVPHHGTLIKVSADGSRSEIVCNGFRAANGVGIGPQGELITSDQEGHWTPANRINIVKPGGFYGNMYSFHRGDRPQTYEPPLVWLPKNVDRSPAAQLWITGQGWSPLQGRILSTSYGTGQMWLVLRQQVGDVQQGGVVRLPLQFPTGVMRGRFHPDNGQLYVCGLVGWSSNTATAGGFFRVRYTDRPLHMPVAMHVGASTIQLQFSEPLDRAAAEDIDNYNVEQWNYRWTANYGSPHFSVANPKRRGQDEMEVLEAVLSADGKSLSLEIEDLQPVMQMQIGYTLKSAAGRAFRDNLWLTINQLGED